MSPELESALVYVTLLTADDVSTWASGPDTVVVGSDEAGRLVEPQLVWVGPGAGAVRLELSREGTPLGPESVVRLEPEEEVTLSVTAYDDTGAVVPGVEDAVDWETESPDLGDFVDGSGVWRSSGATGATAVVVRLTPLEFSATTTIAVNPREPSRLILDGGGQTAPVGGEVTIRAEVLDENDSPMAGQTVSWVVLQGGGSVAPSTSVTDNAGIAEVVWTMGTTPGDQELEASVGNLPTQTVAATAVVGPAARVEVTPSEAVMAVRETQQFNARVEDALGNEIPDAEVTWSSGNTDVVTISGSGLATAVAAGTASIRAQVGDVTGTVSVTVEEEPRVPTTFRVVSGNGQTGPVGTALSAPIRVLVLDQDGGPIPGRVVSWTVTRGGGSPSAPSTSTDAEGLAEVEWTLGTTPGPQGLRAVLSNADLPALNFTASATAGAPALVDVTPDPATLEVGTTRQFSARVEDTFGNVVTGVTVTWSSSSIGVLTVNTAGLATAVSPGTATLTARAGDATGTAHVTVEAVPQVPTTFQVVSGDEQTGTVGEALASPIRVSVLDQVGEPIAGQRVSWTVTQGNGSPSAPSTTTNAQGVAQVGWTLGTSAGTQRLRAALSDTGLDPLDVTALAEPGPAATVEVSPDPVTLTVGDTRQFSVRVEDRFGNLISSFETAWSTSDSGVLSIDGEGLARAIAPGAVTVRAEVDGVAGTASVTVEPAASGGALAVAGGGSHTCGLSSTGEAYCWGRNALGQLGNGRQGSGEDSDVPVEVDFSGTFVSPATGASHSCGLTEAGTIHCWGYNLNGQLGNGESGEGANSPFPVDVQFSGRFTELTTGTLHTCGLTTTLAAYCWGDNSNGQLGKGDLGAGTESSLPVQVRFEGSFETLVGGGVHTCGLTPDGAAYCWGQNFYGQLGNGERGNGTDAPLPTAVQFEGRFVSLVAGARHTCGLTESGAVYCWGDNAYGQLGAGIPGPGLRSEYPVRVEFGGSFESLGAGNFHTCGITSSGDAYCWGRNAVGQLGNGDSGSEADQGTPVAVRFSGAFTAVEGGGGHTCALTPEGVAYCWGENGDGRLGDGTTTSSSVPRAVAPPFGPGS